ncbi:hypothetical protein E2C01_060933 [Portunus trituberculatus]|uniref:Uncharacterized protein n=1 Tax=Portunus trituberculatus TaxID=210409 RepID=A0A5B7H3X4_PORTR|nr:hypothetical protein [Portunus trituberculatus]
MHPAARRTFQHRNLLLLQADSRAWQEARGERCNAKKRQRENWQREGASYRCLVIVRRTAELVGVIPWRSERLSVVVPRPPPQTPHPYPPVPSLSRSTSEGRLPQCLVPGPTHC